jgi:hypothetical protein
MQSWFCLVISQVFQLQAPAKLYLSYYQWLGTSRNSNKCHSHGNMGNFLADDVHVTKEINRIIKEVSEMDMTHFITQGYLFAEQCHLLGLLEKYPTFFFFVVAKTWWISMKRTCMWRP